MKKWSILFLCFLTSCSSKIQQELSSIKDKQIILERNLILTPTSITDQNAAELFDLGIAPVNGSIKNILNIVNNTSSTLNIDINALATKFSAAGNRWSIGQTNTCTGPLYSGSTCRVQIILNNNATTALEDYTQPIETNLVTSATPSKTIPDIICNTGFVKSGSTCVPTNSQFGKMIFTGQKAADVAINTIPLISSLRFSSLADTIVMQTGSKTKRFYMGNPLQTGNTIPVPTIIAPQNGTISKNTCTSLIGLSPLKACFFEVTYNYDVTKPVLSESITFQSPLPLNGVSLDTTGVSINLSIVNQQPVIPVKSALFTQVNKIMDLTSSTQQSRLYVTNTGSSSADFSTITIPSPFIIAKTSCSQTQSIGSTCFIDLKVDSSKTTNIIGVAPSISYGTSSSSILAGLPVSQGQSGSCKSGFSFVNNSCVTSNVSQSCNILNGIGTKLSTDGGQSFGNCQPISCSSNYNISGNSCLPILCTVLNSNLPQAETVSGDLVAGCSISSCIAGFSLVSGNCVSNTVLTPKIGQIESMNNGIIVTSAGKRIDLTNQLELVSINTPSLDMTNIVKVIGGGFGNSISNHSCALYKDGSVKCWGINTLGQLGDGTNNSSTTPVQVVGLTSGVKDISIPNSSLVEYSCALMNDGTVKCWGGNSFGNLGDGTTTNSNVPVNVIGITGTVSKMISGYYDTILLLQDGSMELFGMWAASGATNQYVQNSLPSGKKIKDILSYETMSFVATTEDGLVAYTSNFPFSQLTLADIQNYKQISVTSLAACVLYNNESVSCIGDNRFGQLGNGSSINSTTLVPVIGLNSGVKSLSTGLYNSTCAVMNDGTAQCWGMDIQNLFGDSSFLFQYSPIDLKQWYTSLSGETRLIKDDSLVSVPSSANINLDQWSTVLGMTASGKLNVGIHLGNAISNIADPSLTYRVYPINLWGAGYSPLYTPFSSTTNYIEITIDNYSYQYMQVVTINANGVSSKPTTAYHQYSGIPSNNSIQSAIAQSNGSVFITLDPNADVYNSFFGTFNGSYTVKTYDSNGILVDTSTWNANNQNNNGSLSWDGTQLVLANNSNIPTGNYTYTISVSNNSGSSPEGVHSVQVTHTQIINTFATYDFLNSTTPDGVLVTDENNYTLNYLDMTARDGSYVNNQLGDSITNVEIWDGSSNRYYNHPAFMTAPGNSWTDMATAGILMLEGIYFDSIQSLFNQSAGGSYSRNGLYRIKSSGGVVEMDAIDFDCTDSINDPNQFCDIPANILLGTDYIQANTIDSNTGNPKSYFYGVRSDLNVYDSNNWALFSITQDNNTGGRSSLMVKQESVTCTEGSSLTNPNASAISSTGLLCSLRDGSNIELPQGRAKVNAINYLGFLGSNGYRGNNLDLNFFKLWWY